MRSALLVLAFALVAIPARAQSNDARWEPWVGCWTLATENLRPGDTTDLQRSARPSAPQDGAPRVCVTRPPSGGARFETTVNAQPAIEQTIIADGVPHPITDAECTGTQRAQWSKSGLRLFSSADIRCKDDPEVQKVSGISLIAPNGDWLDIQTVAIGGRETIRIKRYYRDMSVARSTRPALLATSLTIDEVKDAVSHVSPAAVEAALVETNSGFNLTSKTLRDLASADVPERIIDLMVALSYPEKFVVQRNASGGPPPSSIYRDPFLLGGFGFPSYYDRYYYSPYYYEPFGWRSYAFDSPGIIIIGDGGGSGGQTPNGPGRAVNGQGYTRIVPRETVSEAFGMPARSASRGDSGSTSAPATASGSSSGSSSSGSSGGGSASSSGGYSSGGGGGSSSGSSSGSGDSGGGGRTAVPR